MTFWWVNQGRTSVEEHAFGVLWAPDSTNRSFRSLGDVRAGDVVFHYVGQRIVMVGRVLVPARLVPRPYRPDGRIGFEVRVESERLDVPLAIGDIPVGQRQGERFTGSAFNIYGTTNNGYLFELSEAMGRNLLRLCRMLASPTDDFVSDPDDLDRGRGQLVFRLDQTDGTVTAGYRKEQPAHRRALINGRATLACDICGRILPSRLITAAHIKPRATCSFEERVDPNVVMAACTLGCDALYEFGHIVVDTKDRVAAGHTVRTAAVDAAIEAVLGREVPVYSPTTAGYFASHAAIAR